MRNLSLCASTEVNKTPPAHLGTGIHLLACQQLNGISTLDLANGGALDRGCLAEYWQEMKAICLVVAASVLYACLELTRLAIKQFISASSLQYPIG